MKYAPRWVLTAYNKQGRDIWTRDIPVEGRQLDTELRGMFSDGLVSGVRVSIEINSCANAQLLDDIERDEAMRFWTDK